MDIAKYQRSRWGKLREVFALVVDAETKKAIDELKAAGIDVAEFSRDILIPQIKLLHHQLQQRDDHAEKVS